MKSFLNLAGISIIALFLLVSLNSCDCIRGEGPLINETRSVSNFDGIELDVSAKVYISKSDDFKIKIEAQENILDQLETRVKGGLLRIRYEDHCVMSHKGVSIYISMPELKDVEVGGSGDVIVDDEFKTDRLRLRVSGSGSIEMEAIARYIECSISGSGNIDLAGKAKELDLIIRGSGDINAMPTEADDVYVKISGSGGTRVHAVDFLDVNISGSGDVIYKGRPDIESDINGSGDLIRSR